MTTFFPLKKAASLLATSAISLFITALLASQAHALSDDRNQPADISADEVEFDGKTGKRIFIGNVRMAQGTLRIKADKLVAKFKDGKLVDATAYGKLARFRQRPDGKENDVEGEARKIYVNELKNTIKLSKTASLKQGFDVAKGDTIFYNMATDKLKVKGGAEMGSGQKKSSPTKTDDFFKETPKAAPTSKPTEDKTSSETTSQTTQEEPAPTATDSEPQSQDPNELPEKLVLPKKRPKNKSKNGRSRLIIVPK